MNVFQEANELVNELSLSSDSYYNKAESIITDAEYDKKKDRLIYLYEKELLPKKSVDPATITKAESFLNQIGAPISTSEWKKAKHKTPMTSLNKVNSEKEFIEWTNEINDSSYIILDKVDGGSIDLVYENSKLVQALTRGDGEVGEDMLQNVLKMKNVKATIPNFTGNLKGEVIIFRDDFDALNAKSDRQYKNPRNTATGLSKSLDGVNVNLLSILFYDISDDNEQFETEEQKLLTIEKYGIKTCFWKKVSVKQATEVFKDYEINIRASLSYDIDGLVIRANTIAKQEEHGMLGGNPKAKIAWKFEPMKKEAKLLNVEWHIGNSRRITPIANLEPTKMGGVTVKRCTLHNLSMFKEMQFSKNCNVLLIRANDVIPQILQNLTKGKGELFEIPTTCPECGAEAKEDGAYLVCTNDFCSGLGTGNLERWVNVLDIDSIGPKVIEVLFEKGLVKEPADFYKLTVNQVSELERMGERSATKIVKNLRDKMKITLPEFIAGLNMPSFSTSTAKSLMEEGFDSIQKIFNAQEYELTKVKGIEIKTARQIIKGIQSKANIIKNLFDVGITIKEQEKVNLASEKFKGLTFCFTGTINKTKSDGKRFTRDDMHNMVIENGGKVEESVKKGLSYLVLADPNSVSSKTQKAKQLGTNILSEADFFKKIEK